MPAPCQIRGRGKCWEQRPSLDTKPHDVPGTCRKSQGFSSCSEPLTSSSTAAASQGLTRPQNLRHHSLLQLGGTTLGVLHRSRLHRSHGHRQQRRCTSWHVPQHHHPAMRQAGLGAAPRRAEPPGCGLTTLGRSPPALGRAPDPTDVPCQPREARLFQLQVPGSVQDSTAHSVRSP